MNKELENTTPDTEIDSIPEIDQMLAWVYKCGWYASNDWNDWTKDIEAVIRKAKRQIEKIIKERVKSEVNNVLDELKDKAVVPDLSYQSFVELSACYRD